MVSNVSEQNRPSLIVTIDGPAGAGKSTLSRRLAEALSYTFIDTGAMYRAVALAAQKAGVSWKDEGGVAALLEGLAIEFRWIGEIQHTFLNGEDVEAEIRTMQISQGASIVSAQAAVRQWLLGIQRALGGGGKAVLEGRDTGTVVFPKADVKFYLDASPAERARRRFEQIGPDKAPPLEEIQRQIEARDKADAERTLAPLLCASDALRIDTSGLPPEDVFSQMLAYIQTVVLARKKERS